jgi:hypothetical protein
MQQPRHVRDASAEGEVDARGAPAAKDPDRIAGWRVDPSGNYPFRFHNGRRWTEVVLTWEGRIRRGAG